jgi:NAD(P)-dependent dehydrogenase (short-subunit alcohol dehydrogenase family)
MRFEVRGFGVDVVVIEPGLIRTGFGDAAVASVPREEGPYAEFNEAVAKTTAGVYNGPLGRLGSGPDAVAKVIERALTAGRPRTRYKVTASARVLMGQRSLLPDRAWDAVVGSSFPKPGPK